MWCSNLQTWQMLFVSTHLYLVSPTCHFSQCFLYSAGVLNLWLHTGHFLSPFFQSGRPGGGEPWNDMGDKTVGKHDWTVGKWDKTCVNVIHVCVNVTWHTLPMMILLVASSFFWFSMSVLKTSFFTTTSSHGHLIHVRHGVQVESKNASKLLGLSLRCWHLWTHAEKWKNNIYKAYSLHETGWSVGQIEDKALWLPIFQLTNVLISSFSLTWWQMNKWNNSRVSTWCTMWLDNVSIRNSPACTAHLP